MKYKRHYFLYNFFYRNPIKIFTSCAALALGVSLLVDFYSLFDNESDSLPRRNRVKGSRLRLQSAPQDISDQGIREQDRVRDALQSEHGQEMPSREDIDRQWQQNMYALRRYSAQLQQAARIRSRRPMVQPLASQDRKRRG